MNLIKYLTAFSVFNFVVGVTLPVSAISVTSITDNTVTVTIDDDGPDAGPIVNPSSEYYGSGNDDAFAEYGIATYNFTPSDFGVSSLVAINSVEHTLTNDSQVFTDGDSVLFFYSPDDFATGFSGLSYDETIANGLDVSQFNSIFSLGSYSYTPQPSGIPTTFDLNFTPSALTSLLNEINTGSDFQILILAEETGDDVTFSGIGNMAFDAPQLTIDAEPIPFETEGTIGLLALGGFFWYRNRQKRR